MEVRALGLAALLLAALLIASAIPSTACAEIDRGGNGSELNRLRIQAEVLQRMIAKAADVANISEGLQFRIKEMLVSNVSAMSGEDLDNFVAEAKAILADLKESLNPYALSDEENLTLHLAERLEYALVNLNMSGGEFQEYRERLRNAWSLGHLKKVLYDMRERARHWRALNLTESTIKYANESAEMGNLKGLDRALNSSRKVLEVLERVREKLLMLNASPAAIAAIEHAMEKISAMRELLELVKENVEAPMENRSLTRWEIREMVKNRTETRLRWMEMRLSGYIEEMERLREIALEKNLTDLAGELEELIGRLKSILDEMRAGKADLGQAVNILAKAEKALRNAEKLLENASERPELKKTVVEILRERLRLLEKKHDQLRERLKELGGRAPETLPHQLEELMSKLREAERALSAGNSTNAQKLADEVGRKLDKISDKIGEVGPRARGKAR